MTSPFTHSYNNSSPFKGFLSKFDLITMFLIHFGVSMYIIAFGSVVNSELKFAGLSTSLITLIFGFITAMELSRLFFASIVDYKGIWTATHVFLFSMVLLITGTTILSLISIQGSPITLLALIIASIGAATAPTVVDGIFAKSSLSEDRKIALSLQTGRLTGFAAGGIIVAVFYGSLGHRGIFVMITGILLMIGTMGTRSIHNIAKKLSSFITMSKKAASIPLHHVNLKNWTTPEVRKDIFLIFIFLTLFGLGFFAQDSILELFGIEELGFNRDKIGRTTGAWGMATLLGVLTGGALMSKYSDKTIVSGSLGISALGILGVAVASFLPPEITVNYLMIMVFLLGFGGGAASTPSIARLINLSKRTTIPSTIMGIVGIASTVTRSASAIIAGFLSEYQGFQLVFFLEAILLLLAAIPYALTSRWIHSNEHELALEEVMILN